MATQSFRFFNNQTKVVSSLDTYQHTVTSAGPHVMFASVIDQILPMGIIITMAKNGTTVATSATPSATQSHAELRALVNTAVGDVLSITLSSSSATDTLANGFKAILKINAGQV